MSKTMKKTSQEFMEWLGLKVGDRIACLDSRYIFEVIKHENNIYLMCRNTNIETQFIHYLLNIDFEILPQPKRVGDLKCESKCLSCPCIYVCNEEVNAVDKTLYEVLELGIATFTKIPEKLNGAIYDVIKSQLDKEVE